MICLCSSPRPQETGEVTDEVPVAAFAEATDYERYILDTLAPAIPEPSGTHILDLRTGTLT